jgi:hypothetical protein
LIFVADEFFGWRKINDLPDNIIIAKDTIGISQEQWTKCL